MNVKSSLLLVQKLFCVVAFCTIAGIVAAEDPAKPKAESKVALGGHCPVSYQTDSKAVKGDPQYSVPFRGWVYHCASAEKKKTFESDPAKYAAQYGELCTTALGGTYGNRLPSDPTVFHVISGKLYLFSSLRARNAFDRSPPQYIAKADTLYAKPSMFGYCLTSYQLDKKAVEGDPKFTRIYNGLVYQFSSEDAAKAFEKDPARFIPKYDGFCAEGVANGKQFPADPKVFAVIDDRTYLFFDAKAKTTFEADSKGIIEKADAQWVNLSKPKKEPRSSPEP
jgi:YHS domain-containing protein